MKKRKNKERKEKVLMQLRIYEKLYLNRDKKDNILFKIFEIKFIVIYFNIFSIGTKSLKVFEVYYEY